MKNKVIALVVLLLVAGGLYAWQQNQPKPNTPRESLDAKVRQAKNSRTLSAAQEAFLRVQLAVISYQVQNRLPPSKLEDLVPVYFDSVPKNPVTGEPFQYVREGTKYKLSGLPVEEGGGATQVAGVEGCKPGDSKCVAAGSDYMNPNEIQEDTYRYDATNKRDPFQPFDFSAKPRNPNAASPLEQYDLGQLRLTAVLADPNKGSTGIIEDQSGKGFNVKIGTRIGVNGGVIVAIEKDRLKILETETDLTGKETQRIVEMKIQAEPGGSQVPGAKKQPQAPARRSR